MAVFFFTIFDSIRKPLDYDRHTPDYPLLLISAVSPRLLNSPRVPLTFSDSIFKQFLARPEASLSKTVHSQIHSISSTSG